jgi:hypothetical protein
MHHLVCSVAETIPLLVVRQRRYEKVPVILQKPVYRRVLSEVDWIVVQAKSVNDYANPAPTQEQRPEEQCRPSCVSHHLRPFRV